MIWVVVSRGLGKDVGRGRRMLTFLRSRMKIGRSWTRNARFVTNQIRERTEPTPWITIIGWRFGFRDVGARYQYPTGEPVTSDVLG